MLLSKLTLKELWNGRVALELEERPLQHVLWVDAFDPQQVHHHVVGQMEGTVQRVRLTLWDERSKVNSSTIT